MKAAELREKTVEELEARIEELYKERFELRMRHRGGGLGQTHLMAAARRDIARVRTIIEEKRNPARPSGEAPGGGPAAEDGESGGGGAAP